MKAIAAIMLIACSANGALAAPVSKTDILGFTPGMSDDAIQKRLTELKCSVPCEVEGGKIDLVMTKELPQSRLKEISYAFKSGLKPREAIDYVAKQYGIKTANSDIGNINEAIYGRMQDVPFFGRMLVVGGNICRWTLANKTALQLDLKTPGDVSQYTLFLTSATIGQEEKAVVQARKEKERAARQRENRQPRL